MDEREKVIKDILAIFQSKGLQAGDVLDKKVMMDEIKTWPADRKMMVRDAWHLLVGNGLIQEGDPTGPRLTPRGEQFMNS
ncbi:MAG: hypothetical protein KDK37_12390 [Leptospiraceae bacterium]|nr:hypothetical protein [Leptospiraceae bacterium]MCB1305076.1 hypothetical protein [Leptospiraceae bacterium]